jgi:thiol-disulfide isomerase/thioredoxin
MKKIIFTLLFLILFARCGADPIVKGTIQRDKGWVDSVYLIEVRDYKDIMNSVPPDRAVAIDHNGGFAFHHLKPNTLYRLDVIPNSEGGHTDFFSQDGIRDNYAFIITSEKSAIDFQADIRSFYFSYRAKSSDSKTNQLQQGISRVREIKQPVYDLLKDLGTAFHQMDKKDTLQMARFRTNSMQQILQLGQSADQKILASLDSVQDPLLLSFGLAYAGFGHGGFPLPAVGNIFHKLAAYKQIPLVNSLLTDFKRLSVPDTDMRFKKKTYSLISGSGIRLDTVKAKIILLDFWASWCMPCRQSIKGALKALHEKYTDEQLKIIGIITDDKADNAQQAILKDNNPFLQINGTANPSLNERFHIQFMPTYILINMEQHILKKASDEAMLQKIVAAWEKK